MSRINVSIDHKRARRVGYRDVNSAESAGRRALRWLRARRNQGARAPRHIQEKIDLLRLGGNGQQA